MFVLLLMLVSLVLLYRIAFSKPAKRDTPPLPPPDAYEAVTKSRFVLPNRSSSAQYDDRPEVFDGEAGKPDTFAAGNERKDAVIPPDELDEVFGESADPDDLEIERDENESDGSEGLDSGEELEAIEEVHGLTAAEAADCAGGFTYDELTTALRQRNSRPK